MALAHFLLAVSGCLLLFILPAAGLWPLLLPAIPFGVRLFLDRSLFHLRLVDGLLAIFLVTAIAAAWVAYDTTAAWIKLDLLIAGILLYYAISTQPVSNLSVLAGFWFVFGVGVAIYFLLTHDFVTSPVKFLLVNQIGMLWMSVRPAIGWPAIDPTDTAAGLAILTSVYGLYFLAPLEGKHQNSFQKMLVAIGFGIVLLAVGLATSRGAMIALTAAAGICLVWLMILRARAPWRENILRLFPLGVLLFIGLAAYLLILPLGIFGGGFFIGEGLLLNRSELIRNGISILKDFPFLGGGLASFPGLFSQYILVIPYYSLLNSHNLFVDVMIEQGILGGLAFLILYSIGIWQISSTMHRQQSKGMQILAGAAFVSMFVAAMHGLVDDYLYSEWGSALAFLPVGMSVLIAGVDPGPASSAPRESRSDYRSEKPKIWGLRDLPRVLIALVLGVMILGGGLMWNRITAEWLANVGAVKMAKIDLTGYPANQWDEGHRIDELLDAQILFERALSYEASNRLANHRLGLIKLSERDFNAAALYLAKAYQQDGSNRGVIKNLGYSYAWLGEVDKARLFLEGIPEAQYELEVYAWWWDTQGRQDLSANASAVASELRSTDNH